MIEHGDRKSKLAHDPYKGFGDHEQSNAELAGRRAVREALTGGPNSARETTIFTLTQLVHDPFEGFGGNHPSAAELEGRAAVRQLLSSGNK
jgi:hypothetical protein